MSYQNHREITGLKYECSPYQFNFHVRCIVHSVYIRDVDTVTSQQLLLWRHITLLRYSAVVGDGTYTT